MPTKTKHLALAYAMIAPSVLLILFVFIYPVLKNVQFSLSTVRGSAIEFVGLQNFRFLLDNPTFQTAIVNNLKLLLAVPILVAVSLLVAILLHEKVAGWKWYRTVLFFPYLLAIPVAGIVFVYIYQYNGILNEALRAVGLGAWALDWLGSTKLALGSVMSVIIWKEMGFGIVLFLARALAIPQDLYEAARIDGANWWQRQIKITIPEMRPIIEFYFVISVITMLSWVFGYVYVMTSGGPGGSTMVSELFIYQAAFRHNNLGMASAMSVVLLAISLIFVLLQMRVRKVDEHAAY
jgi:ABC-type sugar transport system permease subunit